MNKILTIHGFNGAGKSTTAKILAQRLKYNHFSTGDYAREIARKNKVDIKDMMASGREDGPNSIDRIIDEKLMEMLKHPPIVIDSRLGYYFAPQSFKVYLTADIKISAQRIFRDKKRSEKFKSVDELMVYLKDRHEADKIAYQKRYRTDFSDLKHFDLIIDTGKLNNTPRVVVEIILSEYKNFSNQPL